MMMLSGGAARHKPNTASWEGSEVLPERTHTKLSPFGHGGRAAEQRPLRCEGQRGAGLLKGKIARCGVAETGACHGACNGSAAA